MELSTVLDEIEQLHAESIKDRKKLVLLEAKSRILTDKNIFREIGRSTKGHSRAIMLIEELLEEVENE